MNDRKYYRTVLVETKDAIYPERMDIRGWSDASQLMRRADMRNELLDIIAAANKGAEND